MPQIPKHRKVKRAAVLIKRTQCLKNYSRNKSYKPLCEKLKINNNSLAKALSKEKQECQLLFSQNVALVAEVQDLGLACNKRDAVLSTVLKNAKEALKMLVTTTGCVTSIISLCQELAVSSTNMQMSFNSVGKKDSSRRLSAKSPARGVVKPMVSGHTITKPTINLSRVNMQRMNNPSNLGIIQEVSTTPTRTPELNNNPRSPVAVPIRQRRCESGRTCRMPERLTVASPRISEENERRLSKRSSRHSSRMSGKHSRPKSGRLSGRLSGNHSTRRSTDYLGNIGSPRVKLNDVSKLLQNSQTINIRMLGENQSYHVSDSPENSDDANQRDSDSNILIPETPGADCSKVHSNKTARSMEVDSDSDSFLVSQKNGNTNKVQNSSATWEDPLEGPSWLFSNPQTVPCPKNKEAKTDHVNLSNDNSICSSNSKSPASNNTSSNAESAQRTSPLPIQTKRGSQAHHAKSNKSLGDDNDDSTLMHNGTDEDSFCNVPTLPPAASEDGCRAENEETMNLGNFVTHRRRDYFETADDEDMDDFTLMYVRHPRNMHFDINDLKLPVLEESAMKHSPVKEPEPEITTTIQRITQTCPMPSVSNNTMDESTFDQSTVKLPLLLNNDYKDATPMKDKQSDNVQPRRKTKKNLLSDSMEYIENSPGHKKENSKHKKKKSATRDPSSAKVVLQKLNESDVKIRTPSPDELYSQDSRNLFKRNSSSGRADNSSDSESSNTSSTSSVYALNRPRRKRAPTNLQECNLKQKLRRNQ